MALLTAYRYPGNVRELKNIVEGAYYSTHGSVIDIEQLPTDVRSGDGLRITRSSQEAWQIFQQIQDGQSSFERCVKRPFLKRRLDAEMVRQVIHLALASCAGKYREAFRVLRIPEREYAIMIQFLKRNGCYLDFRPYRKSSR